jgi:glutaminyl-peptide cyclotransferase
VTTRWNLVRATCLVSSLVFTACAAIGTASPTPGPAEHLRVEVIGRRPHDRTSYTEGLVLANGRLFESGGQYGSSSLREANPLSGEVLRSVPLNAQYFGEGLAAVDDRLIQLTWQEKTALVYRTSDFVQIGTFDYATEGWGLCDDGSRLVMSDGTSTLYFRDRTTFTEIGRVEVTNQGEPVVDLNELECVHGEVYANVYQIDDIVRIDPRSGSVTAVIDASGLLSMEEMAGSEVLNGIAYDVKSGNFLLTGKYWPTLFEVRFVPA